MKNSVCRLTALISIILMLICFTACSSEDSVSINGLKEGLCSFEGAGSDDYEMNAGLYVSDTGKDIKGVSALYRKPFTNGIVLNDSDSSVSNTCVVLDTPEADGSDTCDFTGKGSAFACYGDSDVTVKGSTFKAKGAAGLSVFADRGAALLMEDVNLSSEGGTVYEDYENTVAQLDMVMAPWALGIMGTSRCTNLLGEGSTMTLIGSKASSSNWAVLSVDSGHGAALNVADTVLGLTGSDRQLQSGGKYDVENPYTSRSGYGTYVIGDARERFLGVTMNVGTYGSIFTGGSAYYGNLVSGREYTFYRADGSEHTRFTADEDVKTVINSDTFGFMAHQGENRCVIDGATVNSEYTGFVVKSGNNAEISIKNEASINAGNGILLQLMDNDDSTTEFDVKTMKHGKKHEEYSGFPSEAVKSDGTVDAVLYDVKDTSLKGDIYNGGGWRANELSDGHVHPMKLDIRLSGNASLKGAVASTSCIHAGYEGQCCLKKRGITAFDDEDEASAFAEKYQVTSFSQSEYFNIGQVANLVRYSGENDIDVTLKDSALWEVKGTSLVSSVKLEDDARVVVDKGASLSIGEKEYTEGVYTASDFR